MNLYSRFDGYIKTAVLQQMSNDLKQYASSPEHIVLGVVRHDFGHYPQVGCIVGYRYLKSRQVLMQWSKGSLEMPFRL